MPVFIKWPGGAETPPAVAPGSEPDASESLPWPPRGVADPSPCHDNGGSEVMQQERHAWVTNSAGSAVRHLSYTFWDGRETTLCPHGPRGALRPCTSAELLVLRPCQTCAWKSGEYVVPDPVRRFHRVRQEVMRARDDFGSAWPGAVATCDAILASIEAFAEGHKATQGTLNDIIEATE